MKMKDNVEPINLKAAANGVIITTDAPGHCAISQSNIHIFTDMDEMVEFLEEYFTGKVDR